MMDTSAAKLAEAHNQLDACERLVERLHELCCDPNRSPRMQSILGDIGATRRRIDACAGEEAATEIIGALESIGAKIGHLQVACCTTARMPLYADTLRGLAVTQINISQSVGLDH